MQEYLRRLLEDKARLKKWKKIMIALSCIVVVCTVYALSLPAQTLACDKEEHTHTAECYDENNELICEKKSIRIMRIVTNKKKSMKQMKQMNKKKVPLSRMSQEH